MADNRFDFAPQAPAPIPAPAPGSMTDVQVTDAPPTPEQIAAATPVAPHADAPPTAAEVAAAKPVVDYRDKPPSAAEVAAASKDYSRDDVLRTPASELMADTSFKPEQWAAEHPADATDPKVLPVLSEVFRQRRIAPTTLSDVGTGLAGIPGTAARFGSALWDRVTNLHDMLLRTGKGEEADAAQRTKALAEFKAGLESAAVGMGNMVTGLGTKIVHDNPIARLSQPGSAASAALWENMPPEEVQKHFLDAAALHKQESDIGAGEGVWQNITGFGAADLAKQGIVLDPERIASLAMTDPVTFVAFGEGFKLVNAATGVTLGFARSIPLAQQAADIAKSAAGKVGRQVIGQPLRAAGALVSGVGKMTEKAGAAGIPIAAMKLAEGDLKSAAIIGGSALASPAIKGAGRMLSDMGENLAGGHEFGTATRRMVDLGKATASGLAEVGKGAALGGALGLATGDTPEDVQSQIAMGGAFGLIPGAKAGLEKVVTGEMVTPKTTAPPATFSRGYGQFPALDKITSDTLSAMPEDRRNKINFVRELGRKFGAQIYAYSTPAQGAEMIAQAKPGISPEAAAAAAAQNGFTLDSDGKPIIFLNGSASAEGHELGHALEKALSPEQNAKLDAATRAHFTDDEWNSMGENYTRRLLGRDLVPGENWRDALAPSAGNLTPDEYMTRENRADNFDELWKNRGESIGKPEDVYRRIVGALGRGGEAVGVPLTGNAVDFSGAPVSLRSQRASEKALVTVVPRETPPPEVAPKTPGGPKAPGPDPVTKAKDFVATNPTGLPERDAGATDLLNAAQSGGGVRVLYWGAKGDPAGNVTSVRPERRAEIEAQRGAENSKRQLMEKEIFPYKVDNTSKGPQIVGWSPDNFEANQEKLAEWLAQQSRAGNLKAFDPTKLPYSFDTQTGRFTATGRTELQSDAQKFMRNQAAGFTGSGKPVVVPKETASRGYFEPTRTGAAPEPLEQNRADVINYLFHTQIPDTVSRVAPLHLAAQEVAAATGRAPVPPVRPRGEYTEAQLSKAGLVGPRAPLEVNPFRQWVEQTAADSGIARPSLIDVSQRLNVNHIEKTVPSLRTEPFSGNVLTLAAGYQPPQLPPEFAGRPVSDSANVFLDMPADKWLALTRSYKGKLGGGLTGLAWDLGSESKTPADAEALKATAQQASAQFKEAMKTSDFAKAMEIAGRGQAAREAYEAATGSNLEGTGEGSAVPAIRKRFIPDYQPPVPGGKAIEGAAQPPARNEAVNAVAEDYTKSAGRMLRPSSYATLDENHAKRIADYYAAASHDPRNSDVMQSYDALAKETEAQYKAIEAAGYKLEPFTGTGEPYKSSEAMVADVTNNKHLYYLPSASASDASADNLMMRPSGIEGRPVNDIFRAVHDFFGHAKEGYQFGPRGEYNAWREHSQMYSPEAQGALAAETLAQNAWVNFGPHLRDDAGNVAAKGQPGYVAPASRPFAEQKNIVVPPEVAGQAQPEKPTGEEEPRTYIIRHGSTAMNNEDPRKDKIRGHIDVPLSAKGKAEAAATAKQLENSGITKIYASDLDRTMETAARLQDTTGAAIVPDEGLRPWKFGPTIEGKPTADVLSKIQDLIDNPDKRPPDGETFNEFKDRFLATFHRIQDAHPNDHTAIVTHYRGTKLLDSWRKTGTDNDTIDMADFAAQRKTPPGSFDVVDKSGAEIAQPAGQAQPGPLEPYAARTETGKKLEESGYALGFSGDPEYGGHLAVLNKGKEVGYIQFHNNGRGYGELSAMEVNKTLRNQGLGEALFREGAQYLKEAGVRRIGGNYLNQISFGLAKKVLGPVLDIGDDTQSLTEADARQRLPNAPSKLGDVSHKPQVFAAADIGPETQFQPKRRDEYAMLNGGPGGFSKAWIMPGGRVAQLGGMWHHHWLAEDPVGIDAAQRANLDIPPFEGVDTEGVRESAIQRGFARVNLNSRNGLMTIEARAVDWSKQKSAVRKLVESNIDKIDRLNVSLLNESADPVAVDSKTAKLFDLDTDAEKMAAIPFMGGSEATEPRAARIRATDNPAFREPGEVGPIRPDIQEPDYAAYDSIGKHLGTWRDKRKAEAAAGAEGNVVPIRSFGGQAQPTSQEDLFGGKQTLSPAEQSNMTAAELAAHFPESVIPRKRDESIPSNIVGSPLYKEAGSEPEAVKKFADKLIEFANEHKDTEGFKSGARWYSEFVPMLKKNFGADAPITAELLAATSPQNAPEANYAYAVDALHGLKSGRFDKIKAKYEEGLAKLNDGTWTTWAKRNGLGDEPTPAAFLGEWIDKFDLKPRQSNGQLYGISSVPVLQVLARRWLQNTGGPKTQNFVKNLLGTGHGATIDLWADRTMRNIGYADHTDRWRILPKNATGVSDADFAFSQKVFAAAAKQLGMRPDSLQGALWFAEKQRWADNGWSRLDLGDYRKEVPKTEALRAGIEQRLSRTKAVARTKPGVQSALDLTAGPGDNEGMQAQPKKEQLVPFKKIAEAAGANVDPTPGGFVVRVPHLAHGKSRDANVMHAELEAAGAEHVHDTILSPYANVTRYRIPERPGISIEPRNLR